MSDAVGAFLGQYYARHPVNATFTGLHAHDAELPDWSTEGRNDDARERQGLRAELERESSLDATLALANLDVRDAEHESGYFISHNPALWTGEAIFGAVALMLRPFAPRNDRLAPLAARLNAIPSFLDAMRTALDRPAPAGWIVRARRECATARTLFDAGLEAWLAEETLDTSRAAAVRAAAARARDAFTRCSDWLASAPRASSIDTACGERLFTLLLRRGHFCERPASALLIEAEKTLAVEKKRLAELPGAGDDPVPEPYLDAFSAKWEACRAFCFDHNLVEWPEWPLRYVPFPEWSRDVAPKLYWLFYRSPSPLDAVRTHEYFVRPGWTASTITLNHVIHHGALGHHVQNWHASSGARSRLGAIAAVDCANRIGMFLGGSMAEGWACYATELMDEMGFLTPRERAVQQHSRVRMAARAVVDICVHTRGMRVEEAINFYVDETGMTRTLAENETEKNSMFPCTALMYWLGTKGILDLRARVRSARPSLPMRRFHDELLSYGSIPVLLASQLFPDINR